MTGTDFPWRPPLSPHWAERLSEIEALLRDGVMPDYASVKGLANQQLGTRELLRTERLAKRLADKASRLPGFTPFHIGLLGSRTLSYLPGALGAAGLARGLLICAREAPYDAVASFAFSPANPFAGPLDALLVVLDESAFASVRPLLDHKAEEAALDAAGDLIEQIAQAARAKAGCPVLFATLPTALQTSSSDLATPGSPARFRSRINWMLAQGAMEGKWLIWDQAALAQQLGLQRWYDPVLYHAAKLPFSVDACPLATDNIAALLAAMKGKAARALVLDLDNTLWGGVIGDDGLPGIRLGQNSPEGEAFVAFQKFVLSLRDRGVVLAVCSKNSDFIAREPFRSHPEMVLREQHIAVFQASWDDKATNIRAIAETLNLGLESLAFIDDNPAERERVRQELPLISTIEVGEDPSFFIDRTVRSGLFDHIPLNTDDLARAESYGARAAAAQVRAKIGNYEDYLSSLDMRMTIAPFDDVGRPRITQLINKSNQFNLTTRRYNEAEVQGMQEDQSLLSWQVRLEDRFAQHGMIGVVIVRKTASEWRIDSWLQSCRVLERGVEQCVMNHLFAAAADEGAERIRAWYIPTERNAMVADFYARLGFSRVGHSDNGTVEFLCPVADYRPHRTFIAASRST